MRYTDIVILIPSHSLEDFPADLGEDKAAGLLNAFSIAWHPVLLAETKVMPSWHRSDEPPDMLEGRLIIVPTACDEWVPSGWVSRARNEGAAVVAGLTDRNEMLQAALEPLGGRQADSIDEEPVSAADDSGDDPADSGDSGDDPPNVIDNDADNSPNRDVDPELVADFLALGTCYLQMELLTRQMHYFSNMDEVHLQREAVSAAEAAVANDTVAAREHLRACFESLTEARERFYPVDCYLIDLCLLIPRLADEKLEKVLGDLTPVNFVISGQDLAEIAEEKPDIIKLLREAWHRETADIVGGDMREVAAPLLPIESVLWDMYEGRREFRKLFDRQPTTWGRRRFGLSTMVPQIISKFGYHSALHFLLDDGIYPDQEQSKIRWEGCDGTAVDAITRIPLAGDSATSYLRFPQRMSESMEEDQAAAVIIARWPEVRSPWLEDFRRMHNYSAALGRFVTLDDYFQHTDTPGRLSTFTAREYLSPFFAQSVAREEKNPITKIADHFLRRQQFDAACWNRGVANLLIGEPAAAEANREAERKIENAGPDGSAEDVATAESLLTEFTTESNRKLADVVMHGGGNQPGFLVINPLSFPRKVAIELAGMEHPPEIAGPVEAVQFDGQHKIAVVKLPAAGFVWIPASGQAAAAATATKVPMAEPNLLRNEFFEVNISEDTGGLQRIKGYGRSPNRLSQQLAFRFAQERTFVIGEGEDAEEVKTYYSDMRCSSSEVTCAGPTMSEIVTTGEIVDQKNDSRLAGFRQTFRVWRGRPILEMEIELDTDKTPEGDPWSNYFASRFAWNDSAASLTRSVLAGAQDAETDRVESPHYLEIATEQERTTILTRGLPFHRKTGIRMVDSILVTGGETQRKFRFVISIDQNYPMQEALDEMTPVAVIPTTTGPPRVGSSGWFFHIDARNVQITRVLDLMNEPPSDLEPWEQHDYEEPPPGKGYALRMIETEGRHKSVSLRCFRTPTSARQRDFQGRTITDLTIEDDCVKIEVTAYEIVDIEMQFDEKPDASEP